MSEASVEFRNVVKSYGPATVIHNLSLTIEANVTTAIVGESGSGKSTLLQLINGLVLPDKGDVLLSGTPIDYTRLSEIRRGMGYAVQGAGLFPHMTIQENITLMARLSGWSPDKTEHRFRYLLDHLGLELAFAERYPHSLSGGQQQRVSLCRAMMLNPPLMLLDEPFSALDPITRRSIHDEFIRLQSTESRTMVLVTHDIGEASKLAQFLVILRDGKIEQQGHLDEVSNHPATDYVSQLLTLREG